MHNSESNQKNKKYFNHIFSKTVNCRNDLKDGSEVNWSKPACKSSSGLCHKLTFILVYCAVV